MCVFQQGEAFDTRWQTRGNSPGSFSRQQMYKYHSKQLLTKIIGQFKALLRLRLLVKQFPKTEESDCHVRRRIRIKSLNRRNENGLKCLIPHLHPLLNKEPFYALTHFIGAEMIYFRSRYILPVSSNPGPVIGQEEPSNKAPKRNLSIFFARMENRSRCLITELYANAFRHFFPKGNPRRAD